MFPESGLLIQDLKNKLVATHWKCVFPRPLGDFPSGLAGFWAFIAMDWVQSLIREMKSFELCGQKNRKSEKKIYNSQDSGSNTLLYILLFFFFIYILLKYFYIIILFILYWLKICIFYSVYHVPLTNNNDMLRCKLY